MGHGLLNISGLGVHNRRDDSFWMLLCSAGDGDHWSAAGILLGVALRKRACQLRQHWQPGFGMVAHHAWDGPCPSCHPGEPAKLHALHVNWIRMTG